MSEFSSLDKRLKLLQILEDLPRPTFEAVVFAINAPKAVIPGDTAPQGTRGVEFLKWAEGPTGCGIRAIVDVLETYVPNLKDILPEPAAATHWLVPSLPTPFFTGRQDLLQQLHATLTQHNRAALTQHSRAALSGLGGIGKTQTALKYAYQYRDQYLYVFWVKAETTEELLTGYSQIAEALQLPGYDPTDRLAVVGLVKRWLEANEGWLLVIDNADNIRAVRSYLPRHGSGHLLLTTRAQALGDVAQPLEVNKMGLEEGALFLLRRARVLSEEDELSAASERDVEVAKAIVQEMDGLPLALDQAGAYIESTPCSLKHYQALFQQAKYQHRLLEKRGELTADHVSVTATFSLAFEKVTEASAAAADIVRVCAFLAPDDIPEEIFTAGSEFLGEALNRVVQDELEWDETIRDATRSSLIRRNTQTKTLSIHRLVQAVLRAEMDTETQRQWVERVVEAMADAFPDAEYDNWHQYERMIPHAQVVAQLIRVYEVESESAVLLLERMSRYTN